MIQTYLALAADDDADNFQLVRAILDGFPLKLVHAASGEEAVAFLRLHVPNLIFLDINLPDTHGWEILNQFRDDERLNETAVIVLTSHKEPVHRLIGSLQQVAAYLNKPAAPDELRRVVRQCLNLDA